jgi:hypothetical protein
MPGSALITLLACACAAVLAGCGSGDEQGTIPAGDSEQLLTLLDGIEDNVAGGSCEIARKQAEEFVDEVNLLPAEVDDEVKGGLREAGGRLVELSEDPEQCEETTGETGLGGVEPPPEETTTTTAPPTETTTTTTETEPEEEPQQGPSEEQGGSSGPDSGPGGGGPPAGAPPGGEEGEVTIEPPSDEGPTSGGIGDEKVPER